MTEQITSQLPTPPTPPVCPECGARLRDPNATRCWMCREPLHPVRSEGPNPFRLPEPRGDNPGWAVFGGLAMLLLVGLATQGVGVLIVLLVLAFPAMIRALVVSNRSQSAGEPMTAGSVILAFFTSLGITVVVGFAAWMSFLVSCFVVCIGGLAISRGRSGSEGFFVVALVFGGLSGLTVFVLLIRAMSRRKDGP